MSSVELNNFTEEEMVEDLKKYIPNKLPSLPEESVNNTSKLIVSEISDLVGNTIINCQRETRAKIGMSKVKTLLLTKLKYLVGLADIDTGEESDESLEGSETITTYDNRPIGLHELAKVVVTLEIMDYRSLFCENKTEPKMALHHTTTGC